MKMQIADLESKVFELECKNEELQVRVEAAESSKELTLIESNKIVPHPKDYDPVEAARIASKKYYDKNRDSQKRKKCLMNTQRFSTMPL
jgi:hypothetical protein